MESISHVTRLYTGEKTSSDNLFLEYNISFVGYQLFWVSLYNHKSIIF